MYGISDEEVFRHGREEGWSLGRQGWSLLHPLRVDFVEPVTHVPVPEAVVTAPFLAAFAALRYRYWAETAVRRGLKR